MGDDTALPLSKKRAAGREISKDNPGLDDEEEGSEQETGTFSRASEEVLASRRIVKVRRRPASSAPTAPPSNPFAGIRLVPPVPTTAPNENKNEEQAHEEKKAADEENKVEAPLSKTAEEHAAIDKELKEHTDKVIGVPSADKASADTFEKAAEGGTLVHKSKDDQSVEDETTPDDGKDETKPADGEDGTTPVDSKDGTTPVDGKDETDGDSNVNGNEKENDNKEKTDNNKSGAGTEATTPLSSFQQLSSTKNAFTGFAGSETGFSPFSFGTASIDSSPSGSVFAFGSKTDPPSLPSFSFGTSSNGSTPAMQEVPVETGEENEETVFTADSALFEYSEGGWRERGKGELKINVSDTGAQKARLVMRARGNYRLILNANLYPDMKLTKMDKKGITFACVNSATEGKIGLATFALKFKEAAVVETFSVTVASLKGEADKPALVMKTPENSPEAADE